MLRLCIAAAYDRPTTLHTAPDLSALLHTDLVVANERVEV